MRAVATRTGNRAGEIVPVEVARAASAARATPPRAGQTVVWTTAPTSEHDAAQAAKLAAGIGTWEQALEYFQAHGYPNLHGHPHWDYDDHLWVFPDQMGVDIPVAQPPAHRALVTVRSGGGGGPVPDDPHRQPHDRPPAPEPPPTDHAWDDDRQNMWDAWWRDDTLAVFGPASAGLRLQAPQNIPTGPPLTSHTDYATDEEEFTVAGHAAWNYLMDQVIGHSDTLPAWLQVWRYDEPPENPQTGGEYQLRESYDAMQRVLKVTEFALGIVAPPVIEAMMEVSLAGHVGEKFLEAFEAEKIAEFVDDPHNRARASVTLETFGGGEPVTEERISQLLNMQAGYESWRQYLHQQGKPFEGFEDYIHADVNIGYLRGKYSEDFKVANLLASNGKTDRTPEGFVWHHHSDFGRLVLIPTEAHERAGHWGGVAIWERTLGVEYK